MASEQQQQQQINSLSMQVTEANAQIGLMALALDTLRQESAVAIQELRRALAQATPAGSGSQRSAKEVSFINAKTFEGGKYLGSTKESYKVWAKKAKTYLNSQLRGMRQALDLSEESEARVQVGSLKLDGAVEADEKLYDFLLTFTAEEAFQVVEPFNGDGFEAWRQLKRR